MFEVWCALADPSEPVATTMWSYVQVLSCKVHPTHDAWWFSTARSRRHMSLSLSYCFLAPSLASISPVDRPAASGMAHDEAGLVLIVATELGQGNGMRRHGPVHSSSVWGKLGEERRAMVAVVSFRRVAWSGLVWSGVRHRC
ncbi:hypothetical protein J3F84DRAFT_128184 [Trichoderma pleuroticola]